MRADLRRQRCRLHRGFALCAIGIAVLTAGVAVADANDHDGPRDLEILYGQLEAEGAGAPGRLLVRQLPAASAVEFDLVVPDGRVVSFISAFGAGRRGRCEAVYLDAESWFGWCDLYDLSFGSFEELAANLPGCRECTSIRRYFVGASREGCGPVFLGERGTAGGGSATGDDLGLQAVAELASWRDDEVNSLRWALARIGANGCPRLGGELARLLGLPSDAGLSEESATPVPEVPEEMTPVLDYERARGLGGWLDGIVASLP